MNAYSPHDALIAPALKSSSPWRLLAGIALFVLVFAVLNVVWYSAVKSQFIIPDALGEISRGTTARGMAILLSSFFCLLVALWMTLHLIHGRSMLGLIGPWRMFRTQTLHVFAFLLVLYGLLFLVPTPSDLAPEQALLFVKWLSLIPLSFTLLIIQCCAEELLFRGYLQSQLAVRFRSPLLWMVMPSLLFGALHYEPATYGDAAIWLALWSSVFGIVAADLTARSGTLGPAIALHVVNNFMAISVTSMEGYWDGFALYTYPFGPDDTNALMTMLPLEGGILLCGWLTARIALRR
ncbi:CPBP family intramembrane glutamic endopeptidase [Pseudopelagicola sp. nBUS_20]|uniref:CPBP family intramembrane glutamic endopeptidase n=1 Tax=Pseudopelagicola sp. nBUS_20 TaxID=3395317 RepID=UPI003EBFB482